MAPVGAKRPSELRTGRRGRGHRLRISNSPTIFPCCSLAGRSRTDQPKTRRRHPQSSHRSQRWRRHEHTDRYRSKGCPPDGRLRQDRQRLLPALRHHLRHRGGPPPPRPDGRLSAPTRRRPVRHRRRENATATALAGEVFEIGADPRKEAEVARVASLCSGGSTCRRSARPWRSWTGSASRQRLERSSTRASASK